MRRNFVVVLSLAVLAACAAEPEVRDVTPPINWEAGSAQGAYKVGRPYQIAGVYYYPAEDYNYSETGIASWYGPKFHGRNTANGERYDMDDLTAAHRTLPMPSAVRVTNLENGRSIVLRVNDRGPFARGRVIDLSRRAAELLGFARAGTARVRVTVLPNESRRLAMLAKRNQLTEAERIGPPPKPPATVRVEPLDGSGKPVQTASTEPEGLMTPAPRDDLGPPLKEDPRMEFHPVKPTRLYVQAGSFVNYRNAARLRDRLSRIASAQVAAARIGSERFFRVRLGPLITVEDADRVLAQVVGAGHPGARLIVD